MYFHNTIISRNLQEILKWEYTLIDIKGGKSWGDKYDEYIL